MAITLPQAIFAYQVRKTAQDLGMIGTVAGIAFTYFQTRRPKLAFAVGVGMIGYLLYQRWLEQQRSAEGVDGEAGQHAPDALPEPATAKPLAQEPRPALV